MCGWFKDDDGKFDDKANRTFGTRADWIKEGKTFQCMMPILLDIFMQEKYMLDNMDFTMTLQLNEPKFALQNFFKINVKKCTLHMRQINVSHSCRGGTCSRAAKDECHLPIQWPQNF